LRYRGPVRLERVASIADFLASPFGKYVADEGWLMWCASPSLMGSAHWGTVDDAAADQFLQALDAAFHPGAKPPLDVITDGELVDRWEESAFAKMVEFGRAQMPRWNEILRCHAVVVAPGLAGMLMAGAYPILKPRYRYDVVISLDQAFRALRRDLDEETREEVKRIVEELRDPLLSRLRSYLAEHLGGGTLEEAAVTLSVSERTLQRALQQRDTTFRNELERSRVAAVRRLIIETDAPLEKVAREVGYSSASHLVRMYRRFTGETPGRARLRKAR
jgi:AraC-like DNA-binding protein